MTVLADIEWVCHNGNKDRELTQIYAVRVNDNWGITDRFEALVCPREPYNADLNHVAYGGIPLVKYQRGYSEADAVRVFHDWVWDDKVYCWNKDAGETMKLVCRKIKDAVPVKMIPIGRKVTSVSAASGITGGNPYRIIENMRGTYPIPEHLARSDVETLCRLLSMLDVSHEYITSDGYSGPPTNTVPDIPENKDCGQDVQIHLLTARRTFGGLRQRLIALKNEKGKYFQPVRGKYNPCFRQSDGEPIRFWNKSVFQNPKLIDEEFVRLLDGNYLAARNLKSVIGYCHYPHHRGFISRNLMESHRCIQKNCPYMEVNESAGYWEAVRGREVGQMRKRKNRAEQKRKNRSEAQKLENLRERFQMYADEYGYPLSVIRVARSDSALTVFYVSDNSYDDWSSYPLLLERVRKDVPLRNVKFTHIKDAKGRYVTTEEYSRIRR